LKKNSVFDDCCENITNLWIGSKEGVKKRKKKSEKPGSELRELVYQVMMMMIWGIWGTRLLLSCDSS